jgi:hypothetical protein
VFTEFAVWSLTRQSHAPPFYCQTPVAGKPKKKLLDQVRDVMRLKILQPADRTDLLRLDHALYPFPQDASPDRDCCEESARLTIRSLHLGGISFQDPRRAARGIG